MFYWYDDDIINNGVEAIDFVYPSDSVKLDTIAISYSLLCMEAPDHNNHYKKRLNFLYWETYIKCTS